MVDHFGIVMTAILVMFGTIIGLYIWTFKALKTSNSDRDRVLSDVYKTINSHIQTASIHIKGEGKFVPIEVCSALHTSLKEDVQEIKGDVKLMLARGQ
jgi:hypothetical protein